MVDLQTFIQETVKSIVNANKLLQQELERDVYLNDHTNNRIDFDIAITTEKKTKKGISIIRVLNVGINKENLLNANSRIQFSLYVSPKTTKEQEKERQELKT